jgi:hypothetical protein
MVIFNSYVKSPEGIPKKRHPFFHPASGLTDVHRVDIAQLAEVHGGITCVVAGVVDVLRGVLWAIRYAVRRDEWGMGI